jgi:hypothetical protein
MRAADHSSSTHRTSLEERLTPIGKAAPAALAGDTAVLRQAIEWVIASVQAPSDAHNTGANP